jgi:hypothetical protein
MEWHKQTATGPIATEITAARAEDNSTSSVDEIRTIITAEVDYAIVTWKNRPRVWDYWYQDKSVWTLGGNFASAAKAKAKAQERKDEHVLVDTVRESYDSGTAISVEARWVEPYNGSGPITVLCSSPRTAEDLAVVFKRLGCDTRTKAVA